MSSKPAMTPLARFLEQLFSTGEARLTGPPDLGDSRDVEAILSRAFERQSLDVAGPRIEFDTSAGVIAAVYLARACWFAVSRDDPPETVSKEMAPFDLPSTASTNLSIDLTLRYITTVHRRASAQNPDDVLAKLLAETFQRCPLTGVLSDLSDAPSGDLTFAGHPGLQLLYAERLAERYRSTWLPAEGRTHEVVELVFRQHGRSWPP